MNTCGREFGGALGFGSPVQANRRFDVVVNRVEDVTGICVLVPEIESFVPFPVTIRIACVPRDGTSGWPGSCVNKYGETVPLPLAVQPTGTPLAPTEPSNELFGTLGKWKPLISTTSFWTGLYTKFTPRCFTGVARVGSESSLFSKLVHRQNAPPSIAYFCKRNIKLSNACCVFQFTWSTGGRSPISGATIRGPLPTTPVTYCNVWSAQSCGSRSVHGSD